MSFQESCRLLIIDDSPAIHADFLKVLGENPKGADDTDELESELFGDAPKKRTGVAFEIDTVLQGEAALKLVQQAEAMGRPYALAFVDGRMPPGWDGLETIERLRQVSPDMQFVLCTAYSDHTWEEIVSRVGQSDDFVILKKPFDNLEVLQLAQALARKWILGRMVRSQLEALDDRVGERTEELRSANEELAREMSERLLAEAQSQQMAERFVKAFDANPMPMSILSAGELRYQEVNEGFLRLFGLRRDQVLQHTPAELGLCADQELRTAVLEPLEARKTVRNKQLRFRHPTSGERTAEVSADLFDFGDEPCVLMVTQDITDRLAMEGRLRQAQKLEAVGQLAAGIAHDFNNLVTIVMGHAELQLATADLTPDLHDSLQQINAAAQRASGLTRQLLAFSKRDAGSTEVLSLNTLIDSVARLVGRLLGEHIELQVTCPTDLPQIEAQPGEIEQVLINLAVNGRDAMTNGGRLRMVASTVTVDESWAARNPEAIPGRYVCLSVIDQGTGMDEATRKRIFEPFFTTKAPGKGTGMGLASVFGIIQKHRGWIEVDTALGKGSTFRVYLPVSLKAAKKGGGGTVETVAGKAGATVLLVEDEAELRALAHRILTRNGYTVLEAQDGPGALEISRKCVGEIDLVLTDVVMPGGISGVDLANQLREQQPTMRVIYTSGHNEDLMGSAVTFTEGINFIQKPFSLGTLLNTLNRALAAEA